MIPIRLIVEGLYSYQERQAIDFKDLTSFGLFGILGGVGSGKSSILEAITYALYGETERLNKQDKRSYNMLNLKSDRAFIEFDFENHEGNVFRCTRELRRNSRNFNDVRTQNTLFYEWKDETWSPLEHTDAEKLIGLNYTNFKRTIIIPQGQFKEFLELGAKDRTNMMMEIFQLHRFDLFDKVSALNSANRTELDQLNGRLQTYESVTSEEIEERNYSLTQSEERLKSLQETHDKINDRFQVLKQLKAGFDLLQLKNLEFLKLEKQLPDIEQAQEKVETFERIHKAFSQDLTELKRLDKEFEKNNDSLQISAKKLTVLQNDLNGKQMTMEEITPFFENLPRKRSEENDLELIVQIIGASAKIDEIEERCAKGEQVVEETETKVVSIQSEIESIESEIENQKLQLIDSETIISVGEWFVNKKSMEKSISDKKTSVDKKSVELNALFEEFEKGKINLDTFEDDFIRSVYQQNQKQLELEKKRDELMVQQKLAQYSSELHDGKACPLCGSTEHPDIAHADDVWDELAEVANELQNVNREKEKLQEQRIAVNGFIEQRKLKEEELKLLGEDLKSLDESYRQHLLLFVWDDFDASSHADFIQKKKLSLEIEKQVADKNKSVKEKRIESENIRKELDKYRKKLGELKIEESNLKSFIDTNLSNLKVIEFELYKNKTTQGVILELEELKRNNSKVESDHKSLSNQINDLKTEIAACSTLKMTQAKKFDELKNEINLIRRTIEQKLTAEKIENLKFVESVLSLQLNVSEERKTIDDFRLKHGILKNEIQILKSRLDNAGYDDSGFVEEEKKWKESGQLLETQRSEVVSLKTELERLNKAFNEKKALLKQQSKLVKREENLKIMLNLFRGAGFVQYISSIYLSQLCDHANVRFHRMTRNQLRLQLNENNDFEIIDYLNEGRSRSVKTLSGGQAFQVSLSLALALAESVQSNAKAEKNFFFIDEGFGTQDLESVNIVFETLLDLNKENKIVGIISHVEELKERIPMTLTVTKDPERGSLIEVNR